MNKYLLILGIIIILLNVNIDINKRLYDIIHVSIVSIFNEI